MPRENLQVSNAIFIVKDFVATTVVWLLPACKFGIGKFLDPPWLVRFEPVI